MKIRLKFFDIILILIFLIATVLSYAGLKKSKSVQKNLSVKTPEGIFIYPLDKNTELVFDGVIGKTKVTVQNGQAWVTESACENKNCIFMGKLSKSGDFAACLPNAVILTVEGEDEGFDALVD